MFRQRAQLEDAKSVGYAMQDMANDIKVNLKGQTDQLKNKTLKNLFEIQDEASMSGKLIQGIKRQRQKNKYVLWGVYALIGSLAFFILYQTFGWMIPSVNSSDTAGAVAAATAASEVVPGN